MFNWFGIFVHVFMMVHRLDFLICKELFPLILSWKLCYEKCWEGMSPIMQFQNKINEKKIYPKKKNCLFALKLFFIFDCGAPRWIAMCARSTFTLHRVRIVNAHDIIIDFAWNTVLMLTLRHKHLIRVLSLRCASLAAISEIGTFQIGGRGRLWCNNKAVSVDIDFLVECAIPPSAGPLFEWKPSNRLII